MAPSFVFAYSGYLSRPNIIPCSRSCSWLPIRGSHRDVVYFGWPIAPSQMSDRLERRRQNAGVAGSPWLCSVYTVHLCTMHMEPNDPMIYLPIPSCTASIEYKNSDFLSPGRLSHSINFLTCSFVCHVSCLHFLLATLLSRIFGLPTLCPVECLFPALPTYNLHACSAFLAYKCFLLVYLSCLPELVCLS